MTKYNDQIGRDELYILYHTRTYYNMLNCYLDCYFYRFRFQIYFFNGNSQKKRYYCFLTSSALFSSSSFCSVNSKNRKKNREGKNEKRTTKKNVVFLDKVRWIDKLGKHCESFKFGSSWTHSHRGYIIGFHVTPFIRTQ